MNLVARMVTCERKARSAQIAIRRLHRRSSRLRHASRKYALHSSRTPRDIMLLRSATRSNLPRAQRYCRAIEAGRDRARREIPGGGHTHAVPNEGRRRARQRRLHRHDKSRLGKTCHHRVPPRVHSRPPAARHGRAPWPADWRYREDSGASWFLRPGASGIGM